VSRHTTGKWTYEDSQTDGEQCIIRVLQYNQFDDEEAEDPSLVIGSLDGGSPDRQEEQEANAKLICAAPKLLTACKAGFLTLSTLMEQAGDAEEWQRGGEHYVTMQALIKVIAEADDDSARFIVDSASK
jgi:hypothetical protein